MQSILDAINEWIKEILIGAINGNLSTMFGDVNEKVGTIANEVGQTPQGWNANIFSMIQTLSENVIVPIAGLVMDSPLKWWLRTSFRQSLPAQRSDLTEPKTYTLSWKSSET